MRLALALALACTVTLAPAAADPAPDVQGGITAATSGAAAGAPFGPWGIAGGAVAGLAVYLFGRRQGTRKERRRNATALPQVLPSRH